MTEIATPLAGFVLTLALHATLWLGLAWAFDRRFARRWPAWSELLWRGALFGCLLSAAIASWGPDLGRPARADGPSAPLASRSDRAPAAAAAAAAKPIGAAGRFAAPAAPAGLAGADAAAARRPAPRLTLPEALVVGLAQLWLAGAGSLLLLTGWAGARLLGLRRRRGRDAALAPRLRRIAEAVAADLGLPMPTLQSAPAMPGPLVLPGRRVLLPAWAATLAEPQLRALFAHEFAHLRRRDPFWRLAQRLALAPLFFHPLAWRAQRRLDALAEDACDAVAADLLGSGRPLAECLAVCLSHRPSARAPVLAVAMADRDSGVVRRVHRLLEEPIVSLRSVNLSTITPSRRRLALAVGLAVAVALPGLAVGIAADRSGTSISIKSDGRGNETLRADIRDGTSRFQVEMEGKVAFDADESDVVTLAPGASLEIVETRDGVKRAIEFSESAGVIERVFRVDGKAQPIDAGAKAWLAQALPEMFRATGVDAEARTARLLARGGVARVLEEIALIRGDHPRGRYLRTLFETAELTAPQVDRALELAAGIGSDYELARALAAALALPSLGVEQQQKLLAAAKAIGSDFELARLLIAAAPRAGLDGPVGRAWREALAGIGSDFELRRTLQALADHGRPAEGALATVLDLGLEVGSDFEARSLLVSVAGDIGDDAVLRGKYLRLVEGIGSDFETRQALLALIAAGPVDIALADGVLAVARRMRSDFETREVLTALAAAMPQDAELIERYRAVARGLGAFERGVAERALDRFARVF